MPVYARQNVNARPSPSLDASVFSTIPSGTVMDVIGQEISPTDNRRWFLIEATIGGSQVSNVYVRDDTNFIGQFSEACPSLP